MSFLCSFVSDKMGGAVDRESLSTFSYELPIGQLKVELNSNIIPIGKIQAGIFYHRALLFKVILGYVHTAPDEFRPAGKFDQTWFTRDRSIFHLPCSNGTLNSLASKCLYG